MEAAITPIYISKPETITEARFEPSACAFALPEDYVQGEDVECGYLLVPENRAQLPSRALSLAVAIFHPPGGATAPDPILYLSGGPGASVLETLQYAFDSAYAPVLDLGRDLILFDQRGVGRSRPALDCPAAVDLSLELLDYEDPAHPSDGRLTKQAMFELVVDSFLDCQDDLSGVADLSAYHSAASAADVHDLQRVLSYKLMNLWGASYGTRLALTVMRDYPEGIRSVVLDAVYPPDVDLFAEAPANAERALNRLFESCAANPVCDERFPALRDVFFETLARLNAEPVMTTIFDPLTGEEVEAVMNGDVLFGVVFQLLYDTDLRFSLPQLIYDASQDDFEALNTFRGLLLAQRTFSSRGMMFSVQCHEEIVFSRRDFHIASAPPEIAQFFSNSTLGQLSCRVCEHWGAGHAPAIENQPVVSPIPTLVMAGEFDPITPPSWAQRAADTLSQGYVFTYPGVGHGASFVAGCPRDMFMAFLEEPFTVPDDACIADMAPHLVQ
jgi:pimeloyl-ACP methyl ester carboxylesterase